MKVLAFDTATASSSVALLELAPRGSQPGLDVRRVCFESAVPAPGRHGEVLLPRIEHALAEAGFGLDALDLIAVGVGPGSFTGLRVGLATAKGLGFALGVPLRGVCSLEPLALSVWAAGRVVSPVINAQRGEVFAALYRCAPGLELEAVLEPFVGTPELAAERLSRACPAGSELWLTGDALEPYGPRIAERLSRAATLCFDEAVPLGRHLALLGAEALHAHGPHTPAALEPLYLRDSDAKLPDKPLALG